MITDMISALHDLYYGDNAVIAWVVTLIPFFAYVAVQLPAVIRSIKDRKK